MTDGDIISRQAVITMLNKIENAVEDGDGFQFNEWIDYAKDIPSAEKKVEQVELEGDGFADGELVFDFGKCPKCGWDFEEGDKDWEQPYCCHCGQRLHWFE